MGGINTKLPGPCENEEKERHKPSLCERRKEEIAPQIPTVVSLLFGIIFISIFLNRDLDTALVSGGAATEAGEEVGDVVLDMLLVMVLNGECRKQLTQG